MFKWTLIAMLVLATVGAVAPPAAVGTQTAATPAAADCWSPDQEQIDSTGRKSWSAPPAMVIDPAAGYTATLETSAGAVVIELFAAEAPQTVNNFVCLARSGYYDSTSFHRIVEGFVIQGGDPTGTGTGGPGYQFPDEPIPPERNYTKGTLAMANAGANTNGSQFFICTADLSGRLPKNYNIFGQGINGMDVVDALDKTPTQMRNGEKSSPVHPVTLERVTIEETAATQSTTFEMEMVDIAFVPDELTVPTGTEITIELVNNGVGLHNFTIEEFGVSSGDFVAGASGELTFRTPDEPGDYTFVCTVPGHKEAGMTGTLHVVEAAPQSETAATVTPTSSSGGEDRIAALETRVAQLETAVATGSSSASLGSTPTAGNVNSDGTLASPAAIGQTVEFEGYAVTLVGAEIVPPGAFTLDADPGMALLELDLRIENGGAEAIAYGPDHLSVKDSEQGFEFDNTSYTFFSPEELQSGELVPGDFVRGTVIVMIRADSTRVLVRFSTEPYDDVDEMFWAVSLTERTARPSPRRARDDR